MAVNSAKRKEVILNMDGGGNGGKIWRESSYDFWKDGEKKEKVSVNGGSDNNNNNNNSNASEGFDFLQHGQGRDDDPPSKLIGKFLHKQKASGEIALDMDLDMEELRDLPPVPELNRVPFDRAVSESNRGSFHRPVPESPSPVNRVSFDRPVSNEPVRRKASKDSPGKEGNGEVLWCSSNESFRRNSSLLSRTKTRSRLLEPPEKIEQKSGKVAKSGQLKSGQLKSGFLGKNMEDEEDDPLLEEDLPEKYKKDKLSVWILLEWVSLVLIIASLVCSLTIPLMRDRHLWKLKLWKWEVLVLVLICGRLVSGWGIRIIVFFIERNFLLRKRVLYFVYGIRKPVQNCLWLGLVLIAWHYLFDKRVERETKSKALRYISKMLVCLLVGTLLWLVKTLLVKVLASSFHVSTYFDRIQDSLFNQYVIETLSGPPLIETQRIEEEEDRIANEVQKLQNAGAALTPALKAAAFPSGQIGSGRLPKSPHGKSPKLSQTFSKNENEGITIDHLHKLNPKNVSAWNMKRLMNIIRHGALSTLDEQIQESSHDDESANQIRSEYEAKAAARKIFRSVAKQGSRYIYLEDIMRFMREDEAVKTMDLFEGASESRRISKSSLKNWVVNAFRDRRALTLTLNDTKTAVNKLHRMVNVLVGIIILIIWLLILGIATTRFLLVVSSQLLVVVFIFGNTCKTVFEAIIFLFVMHPFDVGDRCEIEGVQMVVEEMNILTTVFLRFDNQKIIYPNSVLATKAINNYYRSPDMGDAVEFCIHISTPAEKFAIMKQRILSYIDNKNEHWCPAPLIIVKDVEDLNRVRIAVWLTHRMNHQDMGERWTRRALLVEEMIRIFKELDIQFRLFPLDINVRTMPPVTSTDHLPSNWTTTAS